MAKVVAIRKSVLAAGTSLTVPLPPHQSGDKLIAFMGNDFFGASYSVASSGWTDVENQGASAVNGAAFMFDATSSSTIAPTFTCGSASREHAVVVVTVRDAPASSSVSASTSSYASVAAATTDTITPPDGNTLVLNYVVQDVSVEGLVFEGDVYTIAQGEDVSNYNYHLMLHYHEPSSTATPQFGFSSASGAARGAVKIAIAIKDDGTSNIPGQVSPYLSPATLMTPFRDPSNTYWEAATEDADPSSSLVTTINSQTTTYYARVSTIRSVDELGNVYAAGFNIATSGDTNKRLVQQTSLNAAFDFSGGEIISFTVHGDNEPPVDAVTGGRYFGVGSGAGSGTAATAAKLWQIENSNATRVSTNRTGNSTYAIQVTEADDEAYDGSIAYTDIDSILLSTYVTSTNQDYGVGFVFKQATMIGIGGQGTERLSYADIAAFAESNNLNTVKKESDNLYTAKHSIQLGDGTRTTNVDTSYQSISYPLAYDAAAGRIGDRVGVAAFTHYIKLKSGDSYTAGPGIIDMGNYGECGIDAASYDSDIYNFDSRVWLNCTPILASGLSNVDYSGLSIVASKAVQHNGRSLNGVTVSQVVSGETAAVTVTSEAQFAAVVAGATFTNNTNAPAIQITGNQSHTGSGWADPGLTVSGNTYDIEYTGTTDFSIQSAVSLSVHDGTNGVPGAGTLTIVTPVVSLTVTSSVAASDIKIFNTGTQTIEAQSTGTSASTSTSGTYDITVQKPGYLPQRQTGITLGASSVPVNITLVPDPVYNASHGLIYSTDFAYNRATSRLTCVTRQAGRDFYSAMIDAFIAQSTLDNTEFPLTAVGIDSIFFNNGSELLDATSEDNWFDAGIRYIDSGTTTAEWCSIKSSGSIPAGVTGRYQTSAGGGTTALRTTGAVNQIIQVYGDATHGNFDYRSYLVIKFQANPYVDTRSDILDLAGVATLEPFEYSVAIEPTTLDIAAGTGGATLTLVDHTAAPITVGGKSFSYEIQDGGTASAEDILRTWDYSIAQTGTYQGTDTFNLPEFIAQSGSTYETRRGIVETKGDTLYGCYVSRGSSDHPDFTRHQSDDGTYYVKPVTANITITNLPDDVGASTRLQIYNVTTATIIYSDDPAGTGYSASYTDGVGITAGDSIRIRYAHLNGSTSFESGQTFVTASTSGFSADGSFFIDSDPVYSANAIDGSSAAVTAKFIADFVDIEVDLQVASNFTALEAFAYFCYTLTLSDGINLFWGGVDAVDVGNYKIVTAALDLKFDNLTTTNLRQTDTSRIYRDDDSYPIKNNGATTGGGGVDVNWKNVVYVTTVTGSNVITGDIADVAAQVQSAMTTQGYTTTRAPYLDDINTRTADILADTGTDIPASIAALQSDVTATKNKTNQLTFTKTNEVDVNIQSVNGTTLTGDGVTTPVGG